MNKKRYSDQQKQEMVVIALNHPQRTFKQSAQELGVGYSTLDK